ncbi:uncharacterized protein SCODWIG_03024 [Saccharomycodes ludwigii]|uniref:ATP synthase subunit H, mitochondrial n=1 Tax=Saccharomycodes ludwigii TaxID=36035 RepID=A0A376B9A0_9ASCO|nr:hypothetical protein SCDLUD_000874 [Saccharomycodes ludwigii]KAH3903253.1 hypothetical protein SCDLUD_000874 [Saccharomycodes ludwigii]SSD61263.1 uncharacterized protein SCODWIG_03024 [Saccharomycodes ludwigii]
MFALKRVALQTTSRRLLSSTLIRRNVIQDLYLKELNSVRLPEINLADANVKHWSPPVAPVFTNELANATDAKTLKSYEEEPVEVVQTNAAEEGADASTAAEEDWLVLEEEPEEEHH